MNNTGSTGTAWITSTTKEMKSHPSTSTIRSFWRWFCSVADELARQVEDRALLDELDEKISGLDPSLSWEVGPGIEKECSLAISPDLDRGLLPLAKRIVNAAPHLENWEIYPARQPKVWNYVLEFTDSGGQTFRYDVSSWRYVLLRYPDGAHEVLLQASHHVPPDRRAELAAIVLESILGEQMLLEAVESFELVEHLDDALRNQAKPITDLRRAFGVLTVDG